MVCEKATSSIPRPSHTRRTLSGCLPGARPARHLPGGCTARQDVPEVRHVPVGPGAALGWRGAGPGHPGHSSLQTVGPRLEQAPQPNLHLPAATSTPHSPQRRRAGRPCIRLQPAAHAAAHRSGGAAAGGSGDPGGRGDTVRPLALALGGLACMLLACMLPRGEAGIFEDMLWKCLWHFFSCWGRASQHDLHSSAQRQRTAACPARLTPPLCLHHLPAMGTATCPWTGCRWMKTCCPWSCPPPSRWALGAGRVHACGALAAPAGHACTWGLGENRRAAWCGPAGAVLASQLCQSSWLAWRLGCITPVPPALPSRCPPARS